MKKYYLIEFADDDKGEYFYCLQDTPTIQAEYPMGMLEAYGEMQTLVMDVLIAGAGRTIQLIPCRVTGRREILTTAYRIIETGLADGESCAGNTVGEQRS